MQEYKRKCERLESHVQSVESRMQSVTLEDAIRERYEALSAYVERLERNYDKLLLENKRGAKVGVNSVVAKGVEESDTKRISSPGPASGASASVSTRKAWIWPLTGQAKDSGAKDENVEIESLRALVESQNSELREMADKNSALVKELHELRVKYSIIPDAVMSDISVIARSKERIGYLQEQLDDVLSKLRQSEGQVMAEVQARKAQISELEVCLFSDNIRVLLIMLQRHHAESRKSNEERVAEVEAQVNQLREELANEKASSEQKESKIRSLESALEDTNGLLKSAEVCVKLFVEREYAQYF